MSLNNLGGLFDSQSRYEEAEPLWTRALEITEKALGMEHQNTAKALRNLGGLYAQRGLFHKADPILRRAFFIAEKLPEGRYPKIADYAKSYINVLLKVGRKYEAQKLRARFRLG
jgi:tetratricopeptide (TPR) repeat protein